VATNDVEPQANEYQRSLDEDGGLGAERGGVQNFSEADGMRELLDASPR